MVTIANCRHKELSHSEQERLVAALSKANLMSAEMVKPRLIETHISYLLLIAGLVYKIKKAVDFGFLNFTTLQARQFYCAEEVRLNRRFAHDLYLGVVPITGSLESPRIGGSGDALEFAVQMREFPQESLAENLLSQGKLLAAEIDDLAARLAHSHLSADRANSDSKFGEPASFLAIALENFQTVRELSAQSDLATLTELEHWTQDEFARNNALFHVRKQAGYIRECHGDLHLGNIVRWSGHLTPFDCIEFNEEFRWIDVLSDIAFLTMDLDCHQRPDFAARLLNQYLEITGDYEGVGLLRFYKVYRAMVRAKVALLKTNTEFSKSTVASKVNHDYSNLLRLARSYGDPQKTALIITHGLSGSGKTTFTQALLERVGAIRVRSDVERKRMQGLAVSERSNSGLDTGLYGPDATIATYRRLLDLARSLLVAGYPVIVDATFLKRHDRQLFRQLARELSVPFAIADLYAPADELRRRIIQRANEGCDASEATLDVLERQLVYREPLTADERAHVFRLDSTSWVGLRGAVEAWKPLIESLSLNKDRSP
jgi:uncharacterized protein